MHVNLDAMTCEFDEFTRRMQQVEETEQLKINVMNREIFDRMHNV
jgi:predicted amino acid-binding ACT domain protein